MAELTERDLADLERGARSADDDHGGCAKDVLALVAEVRRQRAALERIPELKQENAEIHDKLVDAAERAERIEAAAQHLLDVLTAEPYEEAEAALRAALAAAPAPGGPPTDIRPATFLDDVEAELASARSKHAPINSHHEAYSVILEEVDEYWEEVRKRRAQRDPATMYLELVQIAAMAARAAIDLGGQPRGR